MAALQTSEIIIINFETVVVIESSQTTRKIMLTHHTSVSPKFNREDNFHLNARTFEVSTKTLVFLHWINLTY